MWLQGTIQLECLLEAEGRTVRTPALLLNNAGDVMCEEATYAYESDVPEVLVHSTYWPIFLQLDSAALFPSLPSIHGQQSLMHWINWVD